jgi:hypothetical protein
MSAETTEMEAKQKAGSLLQQVYSPGEAVTVGATRVTPIARSWRIGWPGWIGGSQGLFLIHQRPAAVRVESGGQTYTLPIRDDQRMIMLPLLLVTLVSLVIILRVRPKELNR